MKNFKIHLRNFSPLLIIVILFASGCQSKSYYAANNKNLQRFGGYQLETANHMVKVYDLEMLIINLSELAQAQAVNRDTYLAAKEISERFEKMKLETKMEAAIQRTTLSSSLSAESDKYYHRLDNTARDDFDSRYKNMLLTKFEELKSIINDYEEDGQSDRVKEMGYEKILNIDKHVKQFQGNGVS